MTTMTSQEKKVYSRTLRTIEGLIKLREIIMKAESQDRGIRITETIKPLGLDGSIIQQLIKLNAVEEYNGAYPREQGKKLSWVYKGNIDGIVDQKLIEGVLELAKKEQNERAQKLRDTRKEIVHDIINKNNQQSLKKLPTGNSASIDDILMWLADELNKEEQVPGYLRNHTKLMYIKIGETVKSIKENLEPLRECINNLNL